MAYWLLRFSDAWKPKITPVPGLQTQGKRGRDKREMSVPSAGGPYLQGLLKYLEKAL